MDSSSIMEMTINNDETDLQNTLGENLNEEEALIKELKKRLAAEDEKTNKIQQEHHELKSSNALYENMMEEGKTESEKQQCDAIQMGSKRAILLEQKRKEVVSPLTEKVNKLMEEYCSREEVLTYKRNEVKELTWDLRKKKQNIKACDKSTNSKDQKQKFREENTKLKENIFLKRQESGNKDNEISELDDKIKYQQSALEESKEFLESVKSESQAAIKMFETIKKETADLEGQLNEAKSKPLKEGSRGNGAFAELDDRRVLLIKKIKEINKAIAESTQAIARSNSILKKLQIEHSALIEEVQKNEDISNTSDRSIDDMLDKIKMLEMQYVELENQYHDMPCIADPQEDEKYRCYINYFINKPQQEAKEMRKLLEEYSARNAQVGIDLHTRMSALCDIKKSLMIEEDKHDILAARLKEYKDSESKLLKEKEEQIVEDSKTENISETREDNTKPSSTLNVEKRNYEKEKRRLPIKFINITKMVNLDDL